MAIEASEEGDEQTVRLRSACVRLLESRALFTKGGKGSKSTGTVAALAREAGMTRTLLYKPRYASVVKAFLEDWERLECGGAATGLTCEDHDNAIAALEADLELERATAKKDRASADANRQRAKVLASQVAYLTDQVRALRSAVEASANVTSLPTVRRPQGL